MFETNKFLRKPLSVEAVRVTDENLGEIARWVRGRVVNPPSEPMQGQEDRPYINVSVHNPVGDRYSKAFVGDYVVATKGQSFKVYPERAFTKNFDADPDGATVMHDMDAEKPKGKGRPKPGPRPVRNPAISKENLSPDAWARIQAIIDDDKLKEVELTPEQQAEWNQVNLTVTGETVEGPVFEKKPKQTEDDVIPDPHNEELEKAAELMTSGGDSKPTRSGHKYLGWSDTINPTTGESYVGKQVARRQETPDEVYNQPATENWDGPRID